MNQQHIHHVEIKAWADGAEIEYFDDFVNRWLSCVLNDPAWLATTKYRVKPQSEVVRYKRFLWRSDKRLWVTSYYGDENNGYAPEEWDGFIRWIDTEWLEEVV